MVIREDWNITLRVRRAWSFMREYESMRTQFILGGGSLNHLAHAR